MMRISKASKEIAFKHAYVKNETKPYFNDNFNRDYYFDGLKIGECIIHDKINLDIEKLELFVLDYYQNINKYDEESFYKGVKVSERKALCNPDKPVLVNEDNPIVIAFRAFLGKKKSK